MAMVESREQDTPYLDELKVLFWTALAVFVITVGIGLVNGQRVVELGRPVILTHVHTGTLGWITMNMFAVVIWLFTAGRPATDEGRASVRRLARYAAVTIGCYPITFFLFYPSGPLGSGAALGVFGTLALIAIVWLLVWTVRESRVVYMSVARLAALGAVVNLTLGAILGVLAEIRLAGLELSVGNVFDAHPGMMTIGYILPAALAVIEWRLKSGVDGRRDRTGVISVGLLVVAGWLGAAGLLTNLLALLMLMTLFQLVAVVLFVIRLAPRVARVPWLAPSGERLVGMAAVAVVIDVALLVYLVAITVPSGDPVPRGGLIALAHTEFVGMMTNVFFATLSAAMLAWRMPIWPWANHVQFWGMNIGWLGFATVEVAGAVELIRVFTPIMGISILVTIAAHALRLRATEERPPTRLPAAERG